MAGIGLVNFDIDAKSVGPVIALGVVGVAAFFGWRYLQNQQAAASNVTNSSNPLLAAANSAYANDLQIAELQNLFGTSTASTASTTGTSNTTSNATTGASTTGATNTSSTVGTSSPGSV